MPTLQSNSTLCRLKVCLAQDQSEIERALALRYAIFNLELQKGLPQSHATSKDRDKFDPYCDHLIVVDEARQTNDGNRLIVGTYRILRREVAQQHDGFYSQAEFDLDAFYDTRMGIAEVGRSCVHADYRNGSVIGLLWHGLARYMRRYELRYLFGCASLHSSDPQLGSLIGAYLRHANGSREIPFDVQPRQESRLKGFNAEHSITDMKQAKKLVPALIKGYLRIGSYIFPEPAYDPVFDTIDYFVVFDLSALEKRYKRHYNLAHETCEV